MFFNYLVTESHSAAEADLPKLSFEFSFSFFKSRSPHIAQVGLELAAILLLHNLKAGISSRNYHVHFGGFLIL